jgi:hypothetical protein
MVTLERSVALATKNYSGATGEYKKDGHVIRQEVTVFNNVKHADGLVITGWQYKEGGSDRPYHQFCYYYIPNMGNTGVDLKVDIAKNGQPFENEGTSRVPNLGEALLKCQWA